MDTVSDALLQLREEFAAKHIPKDWISPDEAAEIMAVTVQTLRRWELAGVPLTRQPIRSHTRKFLRLEIEALAVKRKKLKHERMMKRGGPKGTIRVPTNASSVTAA